MHLDATSLQSGQSPMLPETRKRLETLLYASGRCTDADRLLRFMCEILGRQVDHRTVVQATEDEAQRLIAAFERAFPDRSAGIAAQVIEEISDRPS